MEERIQKLMAQANIGSRRACEALIEEGRVLVNGKTATLGDKANPEKDTIMVDGSRLKLDKRVLKYFVINKPRQVLSTNAAPEGDERDTVRDMIPYEGHLFTIGRLDAGSEGLMVMTNDGDLANLLSHPRFEHTKTYKVTVRGAPSAATLEKWERGVWLDDSRTAPCYIRVLESTKKATTLRIVMIEGRKRQIRRIAIMMGHPVIRLMRTHIGMLGLGTLRKGMWYEMSSEEVEVMQQPVPEVRFLRRKRRVPRERDAATFAPRDGNAPAPAYKPRPPRPEGTKPKPYQPSSSGSRPTGARKPGGTRRPFKSDDDFVFDTDKPTGERKSYGERKPFGDGKPFGERKPFGDGKPSGERKPFGDGKSSGERKPFGDRKPTGERKPFGDGKPFGERKPFGEGKPSGDRKPFGARKPTGTRKPAGERRPSENRDDAAFDTDKPAGERKPTGDRKPFGDRKPTGERKPFGTNKPTGARKPSSERRPTDSDDAADDKKPSGTRKPPGQRKPSGSRPGGKPGAGGRSSGKPSSRSGGKPDTKGRSSGKPSSRPGSKPSSGGRKPNPGTRKPVRRDDDTE